MGKEGNYYFFDYSKCGSIASQSRASTSKERCGTNLIIILRLRNYMETVSQYPVFLAVTAHREKIISYN
jgi:hypothetical protein